MTAPVSADPLPPADLLPLAALACAPETGQTLAKLRDQVQDLIPADLGRTLRGLDDRGLVVRHAGSRSERLTLSAAGWSALHAAGLRLQRGVKWTAARDRDLPHLALGLPAVERPFFDKSAYLTIAVVWAACPQELRGARPGGLTPDSTGALMDRLIWPLMDRVELGATLLRRAQSGGKVTLGLVQRALLAAWLGRETLSDTPAAGLGLAAARALGASSTKAVDLRKALLRRWARGETPVQPLPLPSADAGSSGAEGAAAPAPGLDRPEDFASAVVAAGRRAYDGSAGPDRVYIVDAWSAMQAAGRANGLDLAAFKNRLVEANSRGLLALSRADVVEVLDPDKVRASEIPYLTTSFHFLVLPPVAAANPR